MAGLLSGAVGLAIGIGLGSPIQYPLINGARHDWAQVEITLAGLKFYCTAVNYKRERNRGIARANHPDPLGKGLGENEYEADVEMLLAEYTAFKNALVAKAATLGVGYGDVSFDVSVQYAANGLDTVTDDIQGCTMDSTEGGGQQGTDSSKRKFKLTPLKILFDGDDDLGSPLQGPFGL